MNRIKKVIHESFLHFYFKAQFDESVLLYDLRYKIKDIGLIIYLSFIYL